MTSNESVGARIQRESPDLVLHRRVPTLTRLAQRVEDRGWGSRPYSPRERSLSHASETPLFPRQPDSRPANPGWGRSILRAGALLAGWPAQGRSNGERGLEGFDDVFDALAAGLY